MSERHTGQRQARLPARLDLADQLWETIRATVEEMVAERVPTMATVRGRERTDGKGGNVLVEVDGEEGDQRSIGMPRGKGTAYRNGDRVMVMKNKAGEDVILGVIASGSGSADEAAIDSEQLFENAVKGRELAPSTVTGTHLTQGAADTGNVKDRAITYPKLDATVENTIKGAAPSKHSHGASDLPNNPPSHSHGASDLPDKPPSHSHSEYASASHSHPNSGVTEKRVKELINDAIKKHNQGHP